MLGSAHRKSIELVKKYKDESLERILERQQEYIRSEILQDACRDGINLRFFTGFGYQYRYVTKAQANIGTATGLYHVASISINAFSLRTPWSSKSILVTGFSDILSAEAATIVRLVTLVNSFERPDSTLASVQMAFLRIIGANCIIINRPPADFLWLIEYFTFRLFGNPVPQLYSNQWHSRPSRRSISWHPNEWKGVRSCVARTSHY